LWVGIALASLVVLIVLVLWIPIDMSFRFDTYGKPKLKSNLVWLFGLVNKEQGRKKEESDKGDDISKIKPKPKKRGIKIITVLQVIKTKGLIKQCIRFLENIIRHIRINNFGGNFRIGFEDPADTGILFATIGATTSIVNTYCPHRINIEPSFEDRFVFEGNLYGTIRMRPIQLTSPFMRFIFSLSTIKVLKVLVLAKWKRKK